MRSAPHLGRYRLEARRNVKVSVGTPGEDDMEGMNDIAMRLWLFFGTVAIAAIGVIALAVFLCRRLFRMPYLILLPGLFLALMVLAAALDTDSEHLIFAVRFIVSLPVSILLPIFDPHHDIVTGDFTRIGLWFVGPIWYGSIGYLLDWRLRRRQAKETASANHTSEGIRRPADGSPKPSM